MIQPALAALEQSYDIQFLRENFLALFPRRDVFIWREMQAGSGWRKAAAPLVDYQILGVISDSGRGLYRGCYWSHRTRFAVFDVDQESKYHTATELEQLSENLAAIGLTPTLYQSSDSTGWHVYLFFDDWEDSEEVNQSLKRWLKAQGYEIKSGTLEIFPSGNALRLPLQKGFAWLAPDGSLIKRREELREEEALASFLCDLQNNQSNWSEAKSRIESQLDKSPAAAGDAAIAHTKALSLEGLEDLYGRGKIQEKWEKGRQWWHHGLSANGERHDAVLCVGHYLWYGDAENGVPAYPGTRHNQTRARLIESWVSEKHNGYCRHLEVGRWQTVKEQIERAVTWRRDEPQVYERPHYPPTERRIKAQMRFYNRSGRVLSPDKMADSNTERMDDARHRITEAVRQCTDNGWQITRNKIAELSGCSPNTVSKHKDLWFLLSIGSGVFITRGASPSFLEEKEISTLPAKIQSDEIENNSPSGLESEFQPIALDAKSKNADEDSEKLCLTPSAVALVGDGERLTVRDFQDSLPLPPFFSLATGSSTGLEDLRYACGISSLAGLEALAPVFLGGIFLLGLWTSQHRQGEQQRPSCPGSARPCIMLAPCLLFCKRTARRSERRKCSKVKPSSSPRAPPQLL